MARSNKKILVVAGAVAVVAMAAFLLTRSGSTDSSVVTRQFYTVVQMPLDVKIVKDGELQAVNNIDIYSSVEGSNTIQTLVPEGSTVKKDDVLIQLDDSQIKQKIEDTTLDVQKAESDLIAARELLDIQTGQNKANLESARVTLQLAQLDLRQYAEGDYPQALATAKTGLEMAQINLKNLEDDFRQVQKLASNGYLTKTDLKKRELDLLNARNTLADAQTTLSVLGEYKHQHDEAAKHSAVAQAEKALVRTERENAANSAQKLADMQAKEQALAIQKRRLDRYKEQFAACRIKAPTDGLVIYASSQDRNAQQPIQEGASVRERQNLLRLPDTSSMKAVVRIQEAQVARLREGQRAEVKIVGLPKTVGATLTKISVLADNSQRWWNPDLKEYPVDIVLDTTPPELKPGVGCTVELYIARVDATLAVPVGSIYSSGAQPYVFVKSGEKDIRPVPITIGLTSETHAQTLSGLSGGEQVLLLQAGQGRELLAAAGIKEEPATRPGGDKRRRGGATPGAMEQASPIGKQAPAAAQPLLAAPAQGMKSAEPTTRPAIG